MSSKTPSKDTACQKPDVKTSKHAARYLIVGLCVTLFNYVTFSVISNLIIQNNNLLWLSNLIATALTTIVAYIAHSKITWKERTITKSSIIRFFIWNALLTFAIAPGFTQLFSLLTPLYEFAYNIFQTLHLPFSYEFTLTTGAFCFTTGVIMILNFLFYDRFVFSSSSPTPEYTYTPTLAKAKVSIIVPIYNTAKYLSACLDSILAQTHQSLEVILVDDGSTDDSPKIIKQYTKKDKRIKFIHQKNSGQSSARNAGLQKATGDYISFIDADDKIAPDFIENLLAPFSLKTTALSVCGIHYKRLRQKTAADVYINRLRPRRKSESEKAYLLYLLAIDGRIYSSVNKLYHANIAKKLTFDASLNFAEDTKFVLDYFKKSKGDIAFILKPLYIYNFGTDTSTIKTSATIWQNWQTAYKNLKSWLGPQARFSEKFWLHTVHLRWRISYLRSKRRAKS